MTSSIELRGPRNCADLEHARPLDKPSAAPPPRAENASAGVRYHDFIVGGASSPPCNDKKWDFDACPREAVTSPVLFATEPGDDQDIAIGDVRQGNVGDCYLMAPLAGLAATSKGRELLRNSIREVKDDSGKVTSYTVTLHLPDERPSPTSVSGAFAYVKSFFTPQKFHEAQVNVDANFPKGHAQAALASGQSEIWPAIVEKAYAAVAGGYNEITKGHTVASGVRLLTGLETTKYTARPDGSFSYSASQLKSDIDAKKIVLFTTPEGIDSSDPGSHQLASEHAYLAVGTGVLDGRAVVYLHNPWNHDDPTPIPVDEFSKLFFCVDVASPN